VTALVRLLDALAAALVLGVLWIWAAGGIGVGRAGVDRAEDLIVALVVVAGARWILQAWKLPPLAPPRVVAVGVALYVVVMTFITVTRHYALRTHALDLGQYVQVIWNIAMGHGPWSTMPTVGRPINFWGEHFSPIFYLLAPLQWVWPGAAVLLVVQTLILGAGGIAVFKFGERVVGPNAAATLATVFLLNPSLHGINLRDIHPAAFAITLLVAAAWAYEAGRWGWCAAALVLTLACREDAAVAVVGFGVWLALARRRWALGAAVAAVSLLILWVDLAIVMPPYRGEPYSHLHRWRHLGDSLPDILVSLVFRPWRWIAVVATWPKLVYLLALLAPLGFLPLLAPRALAAAVPALAMNLLSLDPILINRRAQYQAYVLPFLVLAAVEGFPRLKRWQGRRAIHVLAFALLASLALTSRTLNDLTITKWRLGPEPLAAWALIARVPAGASVTGNDRVVPHLATRREIYLHPVNIGRSEYVLNRIETLPAPPEGYRLAGREGGWVLYQR